MASNRTFTMLKPDAIENGHMGKIIDMSFMLLLLYFLLLFYLTPFLCWPYALPTSQLKVLIVLGYLVKIN